MIVAAVKSSPRTTILAHDGNFTNKTGIEPFDLCDVCMKQLVVFLGCESKRIGVKETINEQEKAVIKKEQDKHAK